MKNWVNIFKTINGYFTVSIDKSDLYFLRKAAEIGSQTLQFPKIYTEELDDLVFKLNKTNPVDNFSKYFVRAGNVSMKSGKYGIGPYNDYRELLISAITCRYGHTSFDDLCDELIFYFIPWVSIKSSEFLLITEKLYRYPNKIYINRTIILCQTMI